MGDEHLGIRALPEFLSWRGSAELLRVACKNQVHWTYRRLLKIGEDFQADLFGLVRGLPIAHQQRLLLAPAFQRILSNPVERSGFEKLLDFVKMERSLVERRSEEGGWNAMGDRYVPGDWDGEFDEPACVWSPDRAYQAPTAGRQLVLDTFCPHYDEPLSEFLPLETTPHTEEQMIVIIGKVTRALDEIRKTSPIVAALINESAQLIRLVHVPDSANSMESFSNRQMIGRIGLLNVHRESRTLFKLMDCMVHESIHSMIYKMELTMPLYMNYKSVSDKAGRSPWSGRELALHSYVHACFVWYGLWTFWTAYAGDDEAVVQLRESARKGFLGGNPLDSLKEEARSNIQPEVYAAVRDISDRVACA